MQVEELIYYIAVEDIQEGSEMRVWYAAFYEQRLQEELKALGYKQTIGTSHVVTRRVPLREKCQPDVQTTSSIHVVPSLTKIVVGRGQVVFTHQNESYSNCLEPPAVSEGFRVTDKYFSGEHVQGIQSPQSNLSSNFVHENNIINKKRDQNLSAHYYKSLSGTNQSNTLQSIDLVSNIDSMTEPKCVVTFTITAVSENYEPNLTLCDNFESDDCQLEDCETTDEFDKTSADSRAKGTAPSSATHKRKPFRLKEPKLGMYVLSCLFLA